MAVYTEVSGEEIGAFLEAYDIGRLASFKGIAEGVENSNYLLLTDRAPFIVTLYEKRVAFEDLPFFLGLMAHLAARGVPCPTPIHGRDGTALRELCGRPAAIVSFLNGVWARRPQPEHCAALGEALARLHIAGADFGSSRPNALSLAGWRPLYAACGRRADTVQEGLAAVLEAELAHLEARSPFLDLGGEPAQRRAAGRRRPARTQQGHVLAAPDQQRDQGQQEQVPPFGLVGERRRRSIIHRGRRIPPQPHALRRLPFGLAHVNGLRLGRLAPVDRLCRIAGLVAAELPEGFSLADPTAAVDALRHGGRHPVSGDQKRRQHGRQLFGSVMNAGPSWRHGPQRSY